MFKSILIPVDLSSDRSWKKAAGVAVQFARDWGAVLHVVSVVPDFGSSLVSQYFPEGFEEKALHETGEKLNAWVAANVGEGVEVHPHVLHGRVYDQIIQAADKVGADCIVMGSHRPELSDYLIGPNAGKVSSHAKQSVFVVRD